MYADMGVVAAKRGKHVITTKPMDISLEKADVLIETCEKEGVKLAEDFDMRYNPIFHKIKRAIDEGRFGKVILGEMRLKWFRAREYYEGWHGTWGMDGGGSLINQGVHQVDIFQWLMGPVDSVCGRIGVFAPYHDNVEAEDLAMALVDFKSGAVGNILTTTSCPVSHLTGMEIHGSKGLAVFGESGLERWEFTDGPVEYPEPDIPKNVVDDMIGVIRENKKPLVDGHEGRKSLELVLAVYESARTGRRVKLPL